MRIRGVTWWSLICYINADLCSNPLVCSHQLSSVRIHAVKTLVMTLVAARESLLSRCSLLRICVPPTSGCVATQSQLLLTSSIWLGVFFYAAIKAFHQLNFYFKNKKLPYSKKKKKILEMKHAAMVSFSLFLTCRFIFIQRLFFTDVMTSGGKK